MRKRDIIIISILSIMISSIISFIILLEKGYINLKKPIEIVKAMEFSKNIYQVFQNDKYINAFSTYEDALEYANKYKNSSIKLINEDTWIYDSIPVFNVYISNNDWFMPFENLSDAINYAKNYNDTEILSRKTNSVVWSNKTSRSTSNLIQNVSYICQYPELYRGCEVTSLAMLLNYKGIEVSKMTLALEIKKDTTKFLLKNGIKFFGNPYVGFVGDIYSSKNEGLGVYHGPIYELLKEYIGDYALDLTGTSFEDLYYYLENNIPVWIITNTWFEELPESKFEIWDTPQGKIKVTYSEHSVLVTGYDDNYIYYNDPMYPDKTYKKPKDKFIQAFIQMGSQAVTYHN